MKKIFIVLFLILTISIPAFAKKQKTEPDWIPLKTANDGAGLYYDLNSIKYSEPFEKSRHIHVKNVTHDGKEEMFTYFIRCASYSKNGDIVAPPQYWQRDGIKNIRWLSEPPKTPEKEYTSGALFDEFCGERW